MENLTSEQQRALEAFATKFCTCDAEEYIETALRTAFSVGHSGY